MHKQIERRDTDMFSFFSFINFINETIFNSSCIFERRAEGISAKMAERNGTLRSGEPGHSVEARLDRVRNVGWSPTWGLCGPPAHKTLPKARAGDSRPLSWC